MPWGILDVDPENFRISSCTSNLPETRQSDLSAELCTHLQRCLLPSAIFTCNVVLVWNLLCNAFLWDLQAYCLQSEPLLVCCTLLYQFPKCFCASIISFICLKLRGNCRYVLKCLILKHNLRQCSQSVPLHPTLQLHYHIKATPFHCSSPHNCTYLVNLQTQSLQGIARNIPVTGCTGTAATQTGI